MDPQLADRRRQQAELYGDPVDVLAQKAQQLMGLGPTELADVVGLSVPMLNKLISGERVRIGNAIAISRLVQLGEFASHLINGHASREDIPLTLAQIHASTTPARTSQVDRINQAVPSQPDVPSSELPTSAAIRIPPAPQPTEAPGSGEFPVLTPTSLSYARTVVGRHVPPTPTYRWPLLERFTRTETWVKHENHTPTGAFKVRGGLNFIERMRVSGMAPPSGLISATRGNHGQSLAFAGAAHGIPVVVVVPEGNSPDKNDAMEGFGAEVITHGSDFQDAREYAGRLAAERNLMAVPSFHPWLIEGVATGVAELHEAVPGLDVVYVPVGMGSGICAQILVRDLLGLRTEIVGVVAERADCYAQSFETGAPVVTATADTFVDGVAIREPDPMALQIIQRGASRILRVSEEAAGEAMALTYRATHNLAEPAGALALAGLLQDRERVAGRRVGVVQTGGNCDFSVLAKVTADVS
ncbi:MAG: threonine dehydratase [Nocardioides sp.]|nr:threonine dehydratase [Nocardioides sp.]